MLFLILPDCLKEDMGNRKRGCGNHGLMNDHYILYPLFNGYGLGWRMVLKGNAHSINFSASWLL